MDSNEQQNYTLRWQKVSCQQLRTNERHSIVGKITKTIHMFICMYVRLSMHSYVRTYIEAIIDVVAVVW